MAANGDDSVATMRATPTFSFTTTVASSMPVQHPAEVAPPAGRKIFSPTKELLPLYIFHLERHQFKEATRVLSLATVRSSPFELPRNYKRSYPALLDGKHPILFDWIPLSRLKTTWLTTKSCFLMPARFNDRLGAVPPSTTSSCLRIDIPLSHLPRSILNKPGTFHSTQKKEGEMGGQHKTGKNELHKVPKPPFSLFPNISKSPYMRNPILHIKHQFRLLS